jgi:ATP-dependent Clp protease protease subunit
LTEIYVRHNSGGKTYEQLASDMERDYFMSAEEARIYGLVDEVINKRD